MRIYSLDCFPPSPRTLLHAIWILPRRSRRRRQPDTFAAIAERSEALQLDSLWLSAHVILPQQIKSGYVLIPGRKHDEHWKENYWEPFTILSYLSAMTSKITLGTSIVVLPMHNPFELAKQVAEVDQLSRGRFISGAHDAATDHRAHDTGLAHHFAAGSTPQYGLHQSRLKLFDLRAWIAQTGDA
jgi:alkanesulfonate monooxygenase SsuD/methylene tetrahydromethanopterin reductase-like flavin-dependent oxidoreductase (luciferase family)